LAVYELIRLGSVKEGRRRLVLVAALVEYVDGFGRTA
jgi:hypothetical protein